MGAKPSLSKEMRDRSQDSSGKRTLFDNPETDENETQNIEDLTVSFGYYCRDTTETDRVFVEPEVSETQVRSLMRSSVAIGRDEWRRPKKVGSFSCFSGAALSANATLANTRICNGILGEEILPCLDSPKTFRRLKFESSTSSSFSSFSISRTATSSTQLEALEDEETMRDWASAPYRIETSFLNASDLQTAGGAAGEDRIQAVCSEENGWLFCAIYDGFNGRDAADFLAGTLYENIAFYLRLLEFQMPRKQQAFFGKLAEPLAQVESTQVANFVCGCYFGVQENQPADECVISTDEAFQQGVLKGLQKALAQTENDFMEMVEQEMDERPDLAMVGSCVLVVLLHGDNLYTLNLGDSRALLVTSRGMDGEEDPANPLQAVQLTESHVVDETAERERMLAEHVDDPSVIVAGRVKGRINLTRAFGAGYLKKANLNNALMGILRVHDLFSPPYISSIPSINMHTISKLDRFIVIGSDGLFDFFSNQEVVEYLDQFISDSPLSDPAKYMLEQVLLRAAENAGMSIEQLKNIPSGRRRKYHDDVTIMVIVLLGKEYRTSSASTSL